VNDEYAVIVEGLSKNFVLPHQRVRSVKGAFTNIVSFGNKKTYETQHALQDISFKVKKGEFFGIVGRNGSGKSTLLKILAGIYQPTEGSVNVKGRVVPFIELGVGFNGDLTGRENVYLNGALLGFSEKEIDAKYQDIIEFAELENFMDQKLKNYSSGMQVRLAFSVATKLAESDILLIDEVLAVGDASFQRKCFEYFRELKRLEKTVIFVSHDMGAIQQYCDRVIMIEKSKLIADDKPAIVASMYNKMFTEERIKESKVAAESGSKTTLSGENRWGDETAEIQKVDAKIVNANSKSESIEISATIRFKTDMSRPIFGFSIKNSTFQQLLGTNTVRRQVKVSPMKNGSTVEVTWKVPNIFNDGQHFVDFTVAHDEAASVADRWPEAAAFTIVRSEDNPYPVYSPDIKFDYNSN
jgi:ABC-2 type transport system ATP-binding protein